MAAVIFRQQKIAGTCMPEKCCAVRKLRGCTGSCCKHVGPYPDPAHRRVGHYRPCIPLCGGTASGPLRRRRLDPETGQARGGRGGVQFTLHFSLEPGTSAGPAACPFCGWPAISQTSGMSLPSRVKDRSKRLRSLKRRNGQSRPVSA